MRVSPSYLLFFILYSLSKYIKILLKFSHSYEFYKLYIGLVFNWKLFGIIKFIILLKMKDNSLDNYELKTVNDYRFLACVIAEKLRNTNFEASKR